MGESTGIVEELMEKSASVDYSIRLPDSEFEVMCAVWDGNPPMTTAFLMQQVGARKGWKAPTLISFLARLEERGFVASFKKGKERYYLPLADKAKYLHSITEQFVTLYHEGSFVKLMDSLFHARAFDDKEADELLAWLKLRY